MKPYLTKDRKNVIPNDEHLAQHSSVMEHLVEAIGNIQTNGSGFIRAEINMNRVIGITECVHTTNKDDIVYAKRTGRPGLSRFVCNRAGDPCNHVVVILKKAGSDYKLITAYIGRLADREPNDRSLRDYDEYLNSVSYWRDHALIFDGADVAPYFGIEKNYFNNANF